MLGHRDRARSIVESMTTAAHGTSAVGTAVALEYSQAALADDQSAEELFVDALAGAARAFPWHEARVQLAFGSWLRRQRRVTESRDPLRVARGTFDTLGARPWALRADQELRATGERGWQPTSSSASSSRHRRRRSPTSPRKACPTGTSASVSS
jgi:hypothetical protein